MNVPEQGWTPVQIDHQELSEQDSEVLDCDEVHFALLCSRLGVPDVLRPFASDWFVDLDAVPDAGGAQLILTSRPVERALQVDANCTVRRAVTRTAEVPQHWADVLEQGRGVLLSTDAGRLPWSPYYRQASIEHVFVVDGVTDDGVLVTDAYRSMTPWGPAQPVRGLLSVAALRQMLPREVRWTVVERGAGPVPPVVAAALGASAAQMSRQSVTYERFAAAYRPVLDTPPAADRLNTEVWRLHRKRSAQRLWLRRVASDVLPPGWLNEFGEVLTRWSRVAQNAFLARRRCLAGKSVPTSVCDAIAEAGSAEEALATRLADALGSTVEVKW